MNKSEKKSTYGNTWESEISDDGEFIRHQTGFREQIRADGSTAFKPAADRYHLYVSYACPWAHRETGDSLLMWFSTLEDSLDCGN